MKPFLSVYGHISIDQILSLEDFPKDNTSVDVLSKKTALGGTGSNISVMAASLGVPTAICSFVGSDLPKNFEDFMESKGLIMDEMVKVDDMETSQAIVVNNRELIQKVLFFQGPQGSASKRNNLLTKNAKESKFVHFCTGEPRYYISVMKAIRDGNGLISFDPAQEVHMIWNTALFNEAYQYSDILFCNQHESVSILKYLDLDSMAMVDRSLVVCTRGSEGCDAYLEGRKISVPAVKASKIIDATGAGDAFRAGFYAGQFRGLSIEESLITGAAAASFVVEKIGALSNIPSWDQVMERADPYLSRM